MEAEGLGSPSTTIITYWLLGFFIFFNKFQYISECKINNMTFGRLNSIKPFLHMAGVLLIVLFIYKDWIPSSLAIILTIGVVGYFLTSEVLLRRREIKKVKTSNRKYWFYKKFRFDSNSFILSSILLFNLRNASGTFWYVALIIGILYTLLFIVNTILSLSYKQYLITVESGILMNLTNQVEVIDLSNFKIEKRTTDMLVIKNKWRTIRILKDDFNNPKDILDVIQSNVQSKG